MMQQNEEVKLFSSIAPIYDFLNHLFSFNIDKKWRKILVDCINLKADDKILDVCTGTGDVALECARRNYSDKIFGIDLSYEMLKIALEKAHKLHLQKIITLQQGDCLSLPFKNNTFNIVTISFGVRNLADYAKGISEMIRVLKKGGKLFVLEFSYPNDVFISKIYKIYLNIIIPLIGTVISGSKNAYIYLSSSIQSFPKSNDVIQLLKATGLKNIYHKQLTYGIAAIYSGEK
jgi:demethylmenaquinone methyltransferase/2-methoxy-6-polyprenyl-1,4-benzoquinol methylase